MKSAKIAMMGALCGIVICAHGDGRRDEVLVAMEKVNDAWQAAHPLAGEWNGQAYAEESPFWNKAAYHIGNLAAAKATYRDDWHAYTLRWAEAAAWQGARGKDAAKWRWDYGETQDHVLFGDWQACFQAYAESGGDLSRAYEVFDYETSLDRDDFIWWADGIFMVSPAVTHLAKASPERRGKYLAALKRWLGFSKELMRDNETGLFFRDAKYVYPKHKTASGAKDFWARGNGWVAAAFARSLEDLAAMGESESALAKEMREMFQSLMGSVIAAQRPEGYWTRSMLDPAQAPGPETSGTAFFAYALSWGIRNRILVDHAARQALEKAWDWLLAEAVNDNGVLGYVQPIGERAVPGQSLNATSQADFGVGAFLLAASEYLKLSKSTREEWVDFAVKLAMPILEPMAEGRLHEKLNTKCGSLELSPTWDGRNVEVSYMEAFSRLMAGIAPWLALPDDGTREGRIRRKLRSLALKSYANAVDPQSPDYLGWTKGGQTLVDAAYLAESFFRAWDALWMPLDKTTKDRYIKEFEGLRRYSPPYQNWVLFCAMEETFLMKARGWCDEYRLRTGLYKAEEWYVGDGWYSDGPSFAFDYYNAYVIHPMYFECVEELVKAKRHIIPYVCADGKRRNAPDRLKDIKKRMQKYSLILERMISPEGAYPVFGRSIPYRMAVFQPLALLAWRKELPNGISEGQVRAALDAVRARMFSDDRNFNSAGFLTLGFNGSYPGASDRYTNNGSLYMTSLFLMPLGLAPSDSFWTCDDAPWTQKKAWSGAEFPKDHKWDINPQPLYWE